MKCVSNQFVFICLSLVIFNSCITNNKTTVKVVSTDFKEQIEDKQNLTFTFNQDVVKEEALNSWKNKPLLLFSPVVEGRFRWSGLNQVVFSPDYGFKRNTKYTVVLNNELVKDTNLNIDQDYKGTFHTAKLKIEDATASWQLTNAEKNQSELSIKVNFNYQVKPASFANIQANIDGETYIPEITNSVSSKYLDLRIPKSQDIKPDQAIELRIGSPYEVYQSENNDNTELSKKINIPKPGELIISGHTVEHNGTLGEIYINTNQKIKHQNLKTFIKLSPEIEYNVETTANSIRVFSNDFDISNSYSVTLKKGLEGILSAGLENEYTAQFSFGHIEPNIRFINKKNRYLSSAGSKNVAIEIINIDEVKVKITKVFANNIKALFKKGKDYKYYRDYDAESDNYNYHNYQLYNTTEMGKTIYEKTMQTNTLETVGKLRLLNLNFEDILQDYQGIYIVEVSHPEKRYLTSSQVVSLSDIGIITKVAKDAIYVFLNSIKTTQPISGASVSLFDQTNQKLINRPSDGEGVVKFSLTEMNMIDPTVKLIEVNTANDFNFLYFKQAQMNSSRFEIGGLRNHESTYLAYMYGERELYRPGETINLAGVVRSNEINRVSDIPVLIKCLLPNGKLLKSINKKLNSEGAFETKVDIPATATTGVYTFELYTGNDIFIKTHPVKVEAFMPDRIKVEANTNKLSYKNGEQIKLQIQASNFFGPPAKNRNYETSLNFSRVNFTPKNFEDYYFNFDNDSPLNQTIKEGKTNEEGLVEINFDIPAHYKTIGQLRGKLITTVFDETGRPVNKANYVDIFTQEIFFGLKRFDRYNKTEQNLPLNFVALDKEGEMLTDQPMLIQVVRNYYKTVLEKDSRGRYRYNSYKQEDIVAEETLVISDKNTLFNFTPMISGSYEVKFGHPDNMCRYSFYAYGRDRTDFTSFEVNKEGKIDFKKDKGSYEVGEQANLVLSTPFQGKILVTVERDNIIKHYYTKTEKRTAELLINITEEMVPNAYVTATLIKSVDDNNSPLTVAYGIENLEVSNAEKIIPITFETEEKIRSNQSYTFSIQSEPNTEMTIAVVDEGILNITNYESPSAANYFYQKRALEVKAYDLYPYLFPELADRGLLIGGGSVEELNNRAVGFGKKRVKICSFWSGIVQTDEQGLYQMTIDVPEFSGDLRIMAMNYKDDRFGAAEANMKVADPMVMSTGLPRFLTPGDIVDIPVMLSNTTENTIENEVNISVEGPLEIIAENKIKQAVSANNEAQLLFKAKVLNALGDAKVVVTTNIGSESFTNTTELKVRPASPLQKRSGSGMVKANEDKVIELEHDFLESSLNGKVLLTNSPIAQFGDKLSYLLNYPHGCLEQKISRVFPLVQAESLIEDFGLQFDENKHINPQKLVQSLIYEIQTLQTSLGGFRYWRGNSQPHWWGSIYAAHFLTEAKKAGYDVNPYVLDRLYDYIKERNRTKETAWYYFFGDAKNETVRREIPYGLFVLALAGKQDIALMNYYKSYPDLLTTDAKYLIGAAYAILGDVDKFRDMVPPSFSGAKAISEFDGSFSSYIRDMAISLYALADAEPDNPQIPLIAKKISEEFKRKRYFNTQEAVFTVLALSKLAHLNRNNNIEAEVYAGDELIAEFTGEENVHFDLTKIKNRQLRIKTKGDGQLHYFYELSGFTEKNEVEEVDHFLEVRKTFYDRNGNQINLTDIQQNDLIVVKLGLRSKDKRVANVVLTDVLPAGFEIENPRLTETANIPWQKNQGTYDHIDFRDDRVNIYTTAIPTSKRDNKYAYKNYYYMVRAVSKGSYVMGPASADAMYDGAYYSYHGGGAVVIQ